MKEYRHHTDVGGRPQYVVLRCVIFIRSCTGVEENYSSFGARRVLVMQNDDSDTETLRHMEGVAFSTRVKRR